MRKNRHAVFVFALMSAGTIFGAALDLALWPEGKTPDFQSAQSKPHFKPLKYNTEGTAYMKAGLCSSAVVGDFDGDGDDDVYLDAYGQTPLGGTWYFENMSPPGTKGAPTVFKQRVRRGDCKGGIRCTLADGTSAVVSGNKVNYRFEKDPSAFEPLCGNLPANVHYGKVRANYWRLRDFDGDGRDDIVVGIGDWREYGWDNRYSPNGIWTNAQIHGYVYVVRNEGGERGHEKWSEPRMLRIENGDPVESFGNASPMLEDWDGDGDLDLLTGDFRDNWLYFENIGTRTEPVYTSGRLLRGADGKRLRADLCITRPFAYDWDKDGRMDFLAGEEDGRLGFYRNTGKVEKGLPVFEQPAYLKAVRDYVHFGSLCTPWAVDWDGDGDQDIIAGNSAGYVAFFENLSDPGVAEPKWAGPKLLSCEKGGVEPITRIPGTDPLFSYDPFRIVVGPNGSIQGPCEAAYGYTCLSAEDWDGDGDIDIMLNNTWGKIILLRNIGTRTAPKLGAPEGVEVEWEGEQPEMKWGWFQASKTPNTKEIVTQWRTTPVMHDMNGDGLMDLILVDTEGYLAFFERFRKTDGALALKSPRRAFLDDATGTPMGVSGWRGNGKGRGGNAGRRKVCIVDWDGDGKDDIVMNSARVGGNAVLWRQTKSGDGTWSFSKIGDLADDKLEWHSSSPCACDFDGNGVPDLLLGAEDGFLYHLTNPRASPSRRTSSAVAYARTAISGLSTEHLIEPKHVGPAPTFSWRMETPRTGARQTAYRIRVRRTAGGRKESLVWDSGEVDEASSIGIPYAGEPLELAHGNCLQTGFLGTAVLLDAVTYGMKDPRLAYALLLQDKDPSWLYSVDQGATTIWERWNSYSREKGFGPASMNSFNHYAYGAVAGWMLSAMAGIRADEDAPGFRHFILAPVPDRRIGSVNARFRSPYGDIRSEWSYCSDGTWKWSFTIPANSSARVTMPDGTSREFAAGTYTMNESCRKGG